MWRILALVSCLAPPVALGQGPASRVDELAHLHVSGSGDVYRAAAHGTGVFELLCHAPCVVDVPVGLARFAMAGELMRLTSEPRLVRANHTRARIDGTDDLAAGFAAALWTLGAVGIGPSFAYLTTDAMETGDVVGMTLSALSIAGCIVMQMVGGAFIAGLMHDGSLSVLLD